MGVSIIQSAVLLIAIMYTRYYGCTLGSIAVIFLIHIHEMPDLNSSPVSGYPA
jgi:hypothetical protein